MHTRTCSERAEPGNSAGADAAQRRNGIQRRKAQIAEAMRLKRGRWRSHDTNSGIEPSVPESLMRRAAETSGMPAMELRDRTPGKQTAQDHQRGPHHSPLVWSVSPSIPESK